MLKKLLTLFVSFIYIIVLSACSPILTDIDEYETYVNEINGADLFMPDLETLPEYENIEIYFYDSYSKAMTLSVSFSEDDYADAKESVLSMYNFLEESIQDETGFFYIPEHEFNYDTYLIKVVDDDDFTFPEKFGMIGYSDDYHIISFLFFYDKSLNRLGNGYEMDEFVDDHFKFPDQ